VGDWTEDEVSGEIEDLRRLQAERIRVFLSRLDTEDDLLRRYFKDRVTVLREEVEAGNLSREDAALLLDGNYARVSDVMSQGSQARRWLIIWVI
jgi:hypothetical protein